MHQGVATNYSICNLVSGQKTSEEDGREEKYQRSSLSTFSTHTLPPRRTVHRKYAFGDVSIVDPEETDKDLCFAMPCTCWCRVPVMPPPLIGLHFASTCRMKAGDGMLTSLGRCMAAHGSCYSLQHVHQRKRLASRWPVALWESLYPCVLASSSKCLQQPPPSPPLAKPGDVMANHAAFGRTEKPLVRQVSATTTTTTPTNETTKTKKQSSNLVVVVLSCGQRVGWRHDERPRK